MQSKAPGQITLQFSITETHVGLESLWKGLWAAGKSNNFLFGRREQTMRLPMRFPLVMVAQLGVLVQDDT